MKGSWYRQSNKDKQSKYINQKHVRSNIEFFDEKQPGTAGVTIGLKGDQINIGRHSSNQIILDSVHTSRFHCKLIKRMGSYWIVSLDPKKPIEIIRGNGVLSLISGEFQLCPLDQIVLGDTVLQIAQWS